jgi:conjugal transfer pilus assembly protein TraB
MNWQEKKTALTRYLRGLYEGFKVSGDESPEILRKKQLLRLGIGGSVTLMGVSWALGLFDFTTPPPQSSSKKEPEKPIEQRVAELSTPLSGVKDGDIWVSRIEKLVKASQEELDKIKDENLFLEKKMNTLMKALDGNPDAKSKAIQELQALEAAAKKGKAMDVAPIHGHSPDLPQTSTLNPSQGESPSSSASPTSFSVPQHFPSVGGVDIASHGSIPPATSYASGSVHAGLARGASQKKKRKLLHLSSANVSDNSNKPPETYLPAGTYFKVVTAMGVVVSTGTNSSSDPQPILLRIVDNGNLPGGLKGKVKDAVLIGTCYGSASAERAICRLKTLSWRDKSNRNIEKPIEGWIASEDGVQGIRAKIIDRSSEIAREAFGAGLLAAASNFFKMQSTSGVFPVSPFGQTNALSNKDALKGAIGGGVGSAMDKLAEFSIKRAESMSPVAYVASGRVLDAVLMRGVDLSPMVQSSLSLVNSTSESQQQNIEQQQDIDRHQEKPQGEFQ